MITQTPAVENPARYTRHHCKQATTCTRHAGYVALYESVSAIVRAFRSLYAIRYS